jgi:hypothetical protein
MSLSNYHVGSMIQQDANLRRRVAACAQEQATAAVVDIGDPEVWAEEHSWEYAMAPGWVAKVATAIEGGVLEWGNDPGVVSDGDILSWVQPEVVGGL